MIAELRLKTLSDEVFKRYKERLGLIDKPGGQGLKELVDGLTGNEPRQLDKYFRSQNVTQANTETAADDIDSNRRVEMLHNGNAVGAVTVLALMRMAEGTYEKLRQLGMAMKSQSRPAIGSVVETFSPEEVKKFRAYFEEMALKEQTAKGSDDDAEGADEGASDASYESSCTVGSSPHARD